MFPHDNNISGSDKPQAVAIRYTMEVRMHFTHGLPSTNQVDLSIGRLQNPSWLNCFIAKSLFVPTMDITMCLTVGICFSYSFVKREICIPKQVMAAWKSNSLHALKSQSAPYTLEVTPNWWFQAEMPQLVTSKERNPLLLVLQHVAGCRCSRQWSHWSLKWV